VLKRIFLSGFGEKIVKIVKSQAWKRIYRRMMSHTALCTENKLLSMAGESFGGAHARVKHNW
jgi:hypothetical protein